MAERAAPEAHRLFWIRLAIGLLQGLLLYLLYRAGDAHLWPSGQPMTFAALALVLAYVPLVAIQGSGAMQARTLAIWSAAATLILAALGAYDRWRLMPLAPESTFALRDSDMPSVALFALSGIALFIAQALIAAADEDRRWIAPYEAYFDGAWKQGLQLALTAVFVGAFWLLLWLGAALFDLIKLHFLSDLIRHAWFAIPATALAVAAALHLSDVRAGLIAGIRGVALLLLSWLLPLMTLLAAGFLIGLLFTGLEPLWQTRSAAALLLAAAGALVILINAAWQNGPAHQAPTAALRIGGTAAALLLVPLVALAGYALSLRVDQHGWSTDRVFAGAAILVAACYAVGYAWAALEDSILRHRWLAGLAEVNVWTSFVILAVLLALFSPIADPARLAVASQVARLKAGKIAPLKFDYAYLRWEGGRYGQDALAELRRSADATIAKRAREVLAQSSRNHPEAKVGPDEIAARLTVYPGDYPLPKTLLTQDWSKQKAPLTPPCLAHANTDCDVFPAELTGHPPDQLIVTWGAGNYWQAVVLDVDADGRWYVAGRLSEPHCKAALDGLRKGQYAIVAPQQRYRDVEAGGAHFKVEPNVSTICP